MYRFRYRRALAPPVIFGGESRGGWWQCADSSNPEGVVRLLSFLHLLAELREGIGQLCQFHGKLAFRKHAQGFELLKRHFRQAGFEGLPLRGFFGAG